MKNTIVIFISLAILCGCNNRKDPFEQSNQNPTIMLKKSAVANALSTITDTIKQGHDYIVYYSISDDEGNLSPNLSVVTGTAEIKEKRDSSFVLTGFSSGQNKSSITAVDYFQKVSTSTLNILVIDNAAPVCSFILTKLGGNSVSIDATTSYDADSKWGGAVSMYEFKVNDNAVIQQSSAVLSQNLPTQNNKVQVRVQDNDGVWSVANVQYITVP